MVNRFDVFRASVTFSRGQGGQLLKKRKVLVLTSRLPYPIVSGGQARMYYLIEELSREFEVDLVAICHGEIPINAKAHLNSFLRKTYFHSFSKVGSILNATFRAMFTRQPLQVGYYYRKSVRRWLEENHRHYDIVLCFHIRTAEYVRDLPCRTIIDLVDAISLGYARAVEKSTSLLWGLIYRFELPRLIRYEQKIIARLPLCIVVSEIDKQSLVSHGASPDRIVIVPHGTKVPKPRASSTEFLGEIDVVFHGKMDYPPNEAACIYYINKVFPLLSTSNDQPNFYIVGFGPTKKIYKLANARKIVVTGFVENLADYLTRAKVAVAPLTYGAGVKTKVLEAMGMGKPVVTTSVGAEGISGENGVHFFIADTPADFAEKVQRLLADKELRAEMGERARSLILREFLWEKSGALLRNLLHAKLREDEEERI